MSQQQEGHIFLESGEKDSLLTLNVSLINHWIGLGEIHISFISQEAVNNKTFYLCCDIIEESPLVVLNERIRYLPILRPLHFSTDCAITHSNPLPNQYHTVCKHSVFSVPFFFHARRTNIENFRLYIIDSEGNIPPVEQFHLKGTLLFKKNHSSVHHG